ncbi:MAG: M1 family metallopeptidase [Bacteroidia bacterium]|nr:M1 family metallopeptidase [Bacteroidia bacterium]
MRILTFIILSYLLAVTACKINKKPDTQKQVTTGKIILEEVVVSPRKKPAVLTYHPAEKRIIDILHTHLEISFDYAKQWVYGKAALTIRPYLHPLQSVILDAKGFTLNRVALVQHKDTLALKYTYDSLKITIQLPVTKNYTDTFVLFLDYIAKPAELTNEGGKAITDSRGLYFINHNGTDPFKPRQIWTQGETQDNSCWFPTNDVPNEKHTQDLFITVEENEVSLSNGLLLSSTHLKNSLRTDHWQQLKPHAPYLTMMAIGNFKIVKDRWRNKEVSYYVEPQYEQYAKMIFGKTPQMMETFSRLTGVDYPWDKFSQVVCRDFISGAMENTTAVVHYEAVQHNAREHLDNPHEDIIVHELFHHWFGDLVTCRSWSNLTLNESFATYGEYMWNEATYGKLYADMEFSKNLDAYLRSKIKHQVTPIRNYYVSADEMFDVVSYQKGSWIIHMLRNQIGDTAFFKGLNLYLLQNKFGTADIHNLRHAMEQASGEDLTQFFNQWYFGKGHPEIELNYYFDKAHHKLMVEIKQIQDSSFGVFMFPAKLSYAFNNGSEIPTIKTMNVDIQNKYQLLAIECENESVMNKDLLFFNFDPNGGLLGSVKEKKSQQACLNQIKYGETYLAQLRAMREMILYKADSLKPILNDAISFLLNKKEEFYQLNGLSLLANHEEEFVLHEKKLVDLINHSLNVKVKNESIKIVGRKKNAAYLPLFDKCLTDSSYIVISASLYAIQTLNDDTVLSRCQALEHLQSGIVQRTISDIYSESATTNKNDYFKSVIGKFGLNRHMILTNYGNYLKTRDDKTILEAIPVLQKYYDQCSDMNKAVAMQKIINVIRKEIDTEKVRKESAAQKRLIQVLKQFEENIR